LPERRWIVNRWLGVGLATALAVVTLSLAATDRLGLYLNPDSTWFAVSMAVILLIGAVLTFAIPLGAEDDHGHDHGVGGGHGAGDAHSVGEGHSAEDAHTHGHPAPAPHRPHPVAVAATAVGGVVASVLVLAALVTPPASLSAELAMSRDIDAPPLFAGADAVTLAATGDTAEFGVGEWATVFATSTNPDAYDGEPVTLTGFVTPGEGSFDLTRLVITHCVIDAQSASIPVQTGDEAPDTGQWVRITGTVNATADGRLSVEADSIERIDEPGDPYEY
jgi:uncharacterized repeat protein (TIGR03943 family)